MKLKPIYLYGIIFVIIIIAIIVNSSTEKEELQTISNTKGEMEIPSDAVHQGIGGVNSDAPSKNNIREDFWEKLKKYETELEANPKDTLLMKNYAQMLGMSHKTEKAIELYERILAIDPNRIDILQAQGLAYYNEQNFAMAVVATKKIIALDDKNLEAQYNLGAILASQGKNEEATLIWKIISEKHPNTEIGKMAKDALVQISSN